ncbi:MAG TPA: GspH/FimT family pseudopilin [Nitrosomonas europaea]|nr:GspH/FimT family pseudopilin [Nitrosomonas europaea]
MTEAVSKGFTMIELMLTISIASILLAMAVPSYQSLMRESRLTTQANELMTSLHYARSEAVKRGMRVTICKSSDGASCTNGSSWQDGWLIFSDAGTAGTVDGGDEVLRIFPGLNGSTLGAGGNFANWVSYLPNGRSQGSSNLANGIFSLCNQASGRNVVVNNSGRPRVEKVSSC